MHEMQLYLKVHADQSQRQGHIRCDNAAAGRGMEQEAVMKCCRCPLYHYWSNESDRGEECAIFGDGWDSPFQYEDKDGTTVGCYLDRHFIERADAERDEYYATMAESIMRGESE